MFQKPGVVRAIVAALIVAVVATALPVVGCGSSPPPRPREPAVPPQAIGVLADPAALEAWADRELAGVPSAVIGLVDRHGLRWSRGVGSRDAKDGPPPDHTTIYRIGSITKLLTATAVLQQRDAGKLGLDDPAAKWIPTLATRLVDVKLRHLVTHTGGVPSVGDESAPYWEQTPPSTGAMLRALDLPLEFPAGTRSSYSNAGMALVGLVVERASGQPWRAYAAQHLLAPLGMRTAVWDRGEVPPDRLALGVGADGKVDPPHWQLGAFEPAGGLYASTDDMAGLARLALGGVPEVLAPASLAEALTDDPLPGPHGVAWVVGELDGARLVGHAGSTMDYSSSLVALPDRGLAVVVLGAGPDVASLECVGAALLAAAANDRAPTSCVPAPVEPAVAARAAIAIDRLRALLAAPTDAGLDAVFTPEFIAVIPRARILDALVQVGQAGPCERHELRGAGPDGLQVVLHCAEGPIPFQLVVEEAPPHRIASLRF